MRTCSASCANSASERSGLEARRVEAIVLVRVEHAAPLVSPAYDDGSTEHEVAQRSLELYRLMRRDRRP